MKLIKKEKRKTTHVVDFKFTKKCREFEAKNPDLAKNRIAIKKIIEKDKAKILKILDTEDIYHHAAIKSLLKKINFLARYIGDTEYELIEENNKKE